MRRYYLIDDPTNRAGAPNSCGHTPPTFPPTRWDFVRQAWDAAYGAPPPSPADTAHTDGEPPAPMFPTLPAWVNGYLAPITTTELGPAMRWCPQWWRHPEAARDS